MSSIKERQLAASDAITLRPHSESDIRRFTVEAPDLKNQYGSGTCAPDSVDVIYERMEGGRREVRAIVRGSWRRPDGELTEARVTCRYTGPPDEWPDWVAGLAHDYHPEPHRPLPDNRSAR